MEIYAMDSALCRASKNDAASGKWIAETFVNDALSRIEWSGTQVLAAIAEGNVLQAHLGRLKELSRSPLANTVHLRRRIAEQLLDSGLEL
jgi:hypothetical protein